MLEENKVGQILYNKERDGTVESTERYIIPTSIPKFNIKALDVSAMNDDKREVLAVFHTEYKKYFKKRLKTIYSFEDWIDATYPHSIFSKDVPEKDRVEIKHRTFKMDNIQLI